MTKILIVTNGYPPNDLAGVEIYSADLAKGLSRKGHHVSVFCRVSDHANPDYQMIDETIDGIRVIRVVNDYKRTVSIEERFTDKRIDGIFETLVDELSPELIHFNHLIALSAHLPLIVADHEIPSVCTLHDYWSFCHRVQLINWQKQLCPGPLNGGDCPLCVIGGHREQFISKYFGWLFQFMVSIAPSALRNRLRRVIPQGARRSPVFRSTSEVFQYRYDLFKKSVLSTHRLLVPSYYVRSQFLANGYPANRIEVLPLGITPMQSTTEPVAKSNKITFTMIGSFIPTKGIDILIKAFKNVRSPKIHLEIYGPDNIAPGYTNEIKQLAIGDARIKFMGTFPPDQRARIYQNTDVLVVPSLFPETFSLVAREALSLGRPVIASRIGALPEVIIDGINGFLFNPGSVHQLASILQRISVNPQILSRLSCPGPVQIHSMDKHIDSVLNIYGEVLSGDRPRVLSPS